jgi:hypothetical protein
LDSRVMIHKIHNGSELRSMQAVYPDSTVFDQGGDFGTAKVIHRDLAARNVLLAERMFSTSFDSASIREECDDAGARLAINSKGTSAKREIKASTGLDASTLAIDDDSDGDGVEDGVIGFSSGNGESQLSVARKRPGKVKYTNIVLKTTEDMVTKDEDCDGDGDDVYDSRLSSTLGGGAAGGSVMLAADLDGDGVMDNSITDSVDAAGVRRRYGSSGNLGSSGQDGVSIDASATSGAGVRCDSDSDGDGVPDNEASLHVTPTTSAVAIKTKGTGAANNRTVSVSVDTHLDSASVACAGDLDGDGIPDMAITQTVVPGSSSVAIKTKGTGADKDRVASISSDTHVDSASIVLEADVDGDGLSDQGIEQRITPTTASLAIQTKGTSAKRVMAQTDPDSAGIAIDDSGIQMTMRTRKGWDGTIKGRIDIEDGANQRVSFDSDGDGFLAGALGIGVASPTHPIDVDGGAYCDGANWVNASDKNLKENFQPVDGRDLLQKIDRLPITRWNYKNESSDVVHIGPTAQDFRSVFGVGSDGKSISTIDPAGIALAAIQQLHKENIALKNQVAELQRRVETLAAQTAETEEIRAELRQLSSMVEIMMGAKTAGESATRLASSK